MLGSDGPVAIGNAKEPVTRVHMGCRECEILSNSISTNSLFAALNFKHPGFSVFHDEETRQITGKANRILQSNLTFDPSSETYVQTNLVCSFYRGCNGWQCREQVYDQQNITTVTNNW